MRHIVLVALVAVVIVFAVSGPPASDSERARQDAYKLAKVREVADELAGRDTAHLDAEQLARRQALIDALQAYADAGEFACNDGHGGHAVPELVDAQGRTCALANLIRVSGHEDLLMRLTREKNHAYAADLVGDVEFRVWLEDHGLSMDEAAYIMGPGYVTPRIPDLREPNDTIPTAPPPRRPTPTTQPSTNPPVTPPVTPPPTPQVPETTQPKTDPTTTQPTTRPPRRRERGAATNTWLQWWTLNRASFFNLRRRYHEPQLTVTPRAGEDAQPADRRPRDAEISGALVPFFRSVAKDRSSGTRATALAAWARTARAKHAAELSAALREYLGDGNNPYRELILMKFGTVERESTLASLRAVLLDTKEGRAFLGQKGSIPERIRAYAAIALGHTGLPEGVDALIDVLDTKGRSIANLRGSAVLALGVLGRTGDAKLRGRVQRYLIEQLRKQTWPDAALAMIPGGLAATRDAAVVPELQRFLTRFRKPRIVRQSCALAIANLAPELTEPLIDTLIGNARRDPDDEVRRFALVALGQIAHRHPRGEGDADPRTKYLADKLARFYDGCFKGYNLQKSDMAWLYLSAGLFGRRFQDRATELTKKLLPEAEGAAHVDRRNAAIIGLGLLGSKRAIPELRRLLEKARDVRTRGTAAEALGLLGDRESREPLRELVVGKEAARVRYGAAVGLAFLADRSSLDMLLDTFATTRSHSSQSILARVLGEIGDREAIRPLLKIAGDRKRDTWTRRRAIAALGMIGQADDEAGVVRYQVGVNYLHATEAVQMVLNLF
ncbi:MAG: HEAT repeat domain-containing protein [Planctomycetota bacterium]|nr:HEAT repeat domain-containing protein [Planctomycetota bacterium]